MVNKTYIDWYGTFIWTPKICNPCYQISENRPDNEYETDFERNGTGIINTLDDPNIEGEYVSASELEENLKKRTSDVEIQVEITNAVNKETKIYAKNTIKDMNGAVITEFKSQTVLFAANERKK